MLNPEKIHIDAALVRRLIKSQFPQWAALPIKPVACSGWDNRTFHLGDKMAVRLPSAERYASQPENEHRWLPKLASHLPLRIPVPLALGKPSADYPWHWSVNQWLEGETAAIERITNLNLFATKLGEFLNALQQCNTTGGPIAGAQNFYRGGPLSTYDLQTRQTIAALADKAIDVELITAVWNTALSSTWQNAPVWVHGDIAGGNLLVMQGELSAVIDFGQLAIGDPACDLAIAWTLFNAESRETFRKALSLDHNTWARARGWALWKALCAAFPCSDRINKRVIDEVLADYKQQ